MKTNMKMFPKFQKILQKNMSNSNKFYKRDLFFKDLSVKDRDVELYNLIEKEKTRQRVGIELIASENYVGKSVLECLGSVLTNKYSEGYIGKKYYGKNNNNRIK